MKTKKVILVALAIVLLGVASIALTDQAVTNTIPQATEDPGRGGGG